AARRRGAPLLSRPAGEPVSDRVEVPGRVSPTVRPPSGPGVPDEGRLLVRPGRGGVTRLLRHDAAGVPARVRPVRAQVRDRRGGPGHDRRWREPRVHGQRRCGGGPVRRMPQRRLPGRPGGGDPPPARARRHHGPPAPHPGLHPVRGGKDWVTGANKSEHHVTGANAERDFRVDEYADLVQIREGDPCPACGQPLRIERSIVVGHIYQIGTTYSEPLKATFVDEDGTERPYVMGCYGLGITRTIAAAVEQNHDEHGITWPRALAPFEVVVIVANRDDEQVTAEGE